MLKKINLTISSRIDGLDENGFPEGEAELSSETHSAAMKITDGEISLSYRESTEGGSVFCDISPSDGCVSVRRSGAINSLILFQEGNIYNTVYEIAPYKFDMSVQTLKIRSTMTDVGGSIEIFYLMTVGGASRRVKMTIEASEVSV